MISSFFHDPHVADEVRRGILALPVVLKGKDHLRTLRSRERGVVETTIVSSLEMRPPMIARFPLMSKPLILAWTVISAPRKMTITWCLHGVHSSGWETGVQPSVC